MPGAREGRVGEHGIRLVPVQATGTLSYDEFARTLLTAGSYNTLPLEIFGMTTNVTTPVLYALGTLTTVFSLIMIGVFLGFAWWSAKRKARAGSDAGKGTV